MSNTFAFPKDFSTESGGGSYYKFEQGANKFRIMSEPVFGQEYWKSEKDEKGDLIPGVDGFPKRKPIRAKLTKSIPTSELEVDRWGNPGRVNHFMAMVVYDYKEGLFKILSITQKQINAGIKALAESEDWGDPREYDITVTRNGSGRDTKYTVMPGAKKAIPENIMDAYKEKTFNLEALFDGEDPFADVKGDNSEMPF
jgi:hypothetical protein